MKLNIFMYIIILLSIHNLNSLNVELTIEEHSIIDRILEPVSFGVPIAYETNITDENNFCIKNSSNNIIPAQFKVLERWDTEVSNNSGRIKWILIDFQATVLSNSTVNYYLQDSAGAVTSPTLIITNIANVIIINTGNAEFTIDKNNFNIITSAKYNGVNILNSDSSGIREEDSSIYFSHNGVPDIFEIEEAGTMKAVVHVEGYNVNGVSNNGLRYVCRIHFYAGKPYAKVVFYYIHDKNLVEAVMNEPSQVQQIDRSIKSLKVNFDLDFVGNPSYLIGREKNNTPWTGIISAGNKYCRHHLFDQYLSSEGNGTGQLVGWANLYNTEKGLLIAIKNFYNKWPHGINLNLNGRLSYEVLPDSLGESSGLHDFYIYQAYREEFIIYIHGQSRDIVEMQNLSEGFIQDPLFAHPSKIYMCSTKGLGELSPSPSSVFTGFEVSLEDAYDKTISYQISNNMNGRWDYGGLYDQGISGNPSSYYDGIGVATRQFCRTSDMKWLNFARNYAENFTSVDLYYCGEGTFNRNRWNGFSSGYLGTHHRNGNFIFASWIEGTNLLYRLTGDEWFWDRSVDQANTFYNRGMTPHAGGSYFGTLAREGAMGVMNMIRVWEINRDPNLFTWITGHMDYLLTGQQPNGTFSNDGYDNRHWQVIMNCGPGLYRTYLATGNNLYRNAIINYADAMQPFLQGGCMIFENGNGYDYVERMCIQTWSSDNCALTGPRISCVNAYAYLLTGDQKYWNEANRQLNENWEDYGWQNGLGKTANTYHWCMLMEGIISSSSSIEEQAFDIIDNEVSLQISLNPCSNYPEIKYSIPHTERVKLTIYNLSGQRIRDLVNSEKSSGVYTVIWDENDNSGRKVSSGVYIFQLYVGNYKDTKKIIFLE